MRIARSIIQALGVLTLGASLPGLQGQAPSQGFEQQLRSQYQLTRVGGNGTVVGQPGAILVMQEDGLTAIPASYGPYWYSTFKKGGHIKSSMVQHGGSVAIHERRPFQVGEKLYLVNMEVTATEIVFNVQSCGACDLSVSPNEPPYRARLAFQFDKGYLSTADSKQVLETVGQVFGLAASAPPPPPPPPAPPRAPVVQLKLPSIYVSAQAQTDQLRLNADNSFSLQEAGQSYRGTFTVNGNTVELRITGGPTTTATIQGSNLTDSSGQTWVLQEQPAGTPAGGATLKNEDIIKMAKAGFDDAIIIAKIGSSQCQFDTSTDALIQLKQSGVSAAVIKTIVAAGR
jgi:hypothetical protein